MDRMLAKNCNCSSFLNSSIQNRLSSPPCPSQTGRGFLWRMAGLVLGGLLAGVLPVSAAPVPKDVPPDVWAKIGPQVERQMYAFDAEGKASNREQEFQVAAGSAGLAVNDTLRLRATAINGERLPEAAPVIRDNRVEYPRGAVTEWYENRQDGVEQGFTIQDEEGTRMDEIRLTLAFGDELSVEIAPDGQAAVLVQGSKRYRYAGLKAWDATGRELTCVMQPASAPDSSGFGLPSSSLLQLVCDARDAQFPITIDPILTRMEAKLTASDMASLNSFGCSVSVAGDVALVGAAYADPGGVSYAGAAYVFERNAGGTNAWGQVAKLTASDLAPDDYFGYAVSVAGDVALVGALYANSGGVINVGAAYVYERNAGGTNAWGEVAKLTASDSATGNYFGWSVSVAGDVALVGAAYADPGGVNNAGAAYVYERNAGGTNAWGEVAQLTASDKAGNDTFGQSVSVAGDVALVGAVYANPGGVINAGAAYVYERNAGGTNAWGEVSKLIASDATADDAFGSGVSVAGDVALVGASGEDPNGVANAGAAYVYERNAGGTNVWDEVAKLTASDPAVNEKFGASVSVAGDVALVGARSADPGGVSDAGAAYVFGRNEGGTNAWGEVAQLTASDLAVNDYFGSSVSVAGNVALVGASGADPGGLSSAGAAYIIPFTRADWREKSRLTAPEPALGDQFGYSVSVDGDVALVGAKYEEPDGQWNTGAAYVYERNAGGTNAWGEVAKLTASDPVGNGYFGTSVSVAGDVALVGSTGAEPDGATGLDAGAAYVFERNAGGTNAWGEVAKLTASDKAGDDQFGCSVSVDGDVALVGAYYADPGGLSSAGAAYVFERNTGGTNVWGEVTKLTASDQAAFDRFGASVSVAGDVALVGAAYADPGGLSSAGAAYVFERNAGGTNAWAEVMKLTASAPAEGVQFGTSVSVDGDVALVGAHYANSGGVSSAGAAYVYERNAGGTNAWGEVTKLTASDLAVNECFGGSVSVDGDVALVGRSTFRAQACVFERNAGGTNAWGEVAQLTMSDPPLGTRSGYSVSVDGDVALIGGKGVDFGIVTNAGAAYIFEGLINGIPEMTVRGTNSWWTFANGEAASVSKGTDFASLPWGQSKTNTFMITNAGTAALSISGIITNGTGAGSFAVSALPTTVSAGSASNFSVIFSPGAGGIYTCVVAIANSSTNTPFNLCLSGTGGKHDQAIAFPAIGNQITTNEVGLAATADSGLPVSFSAPWWASIVGGTNLTFTRAGSASIVASQAGNGNYNAAMDVTNTFTVTKAWAALHLQDLAQTYDGTSRPASASTIPPGLRVSLLYEEPPFNGEDLWPSAPVNAGSYAVWGTIIEDMYEGYAADLLLVTKAEATVYFQDLAQSYDGTARSITATTMPAGLTVEITYDGLATAPTNAGTYAITGTVNAINYQGSIVDSLVVAQADQTITFPALGDKVTTDEVGLAATADSGLAVSFSVASGPASIAGGTNLTFSGEGSVSIVASQAGNGNWNPATDVTNILNVTKAAASVVLQGLVQTYDGTARAISATTMPAGLTLEFTYDGVVTAPTNAGVYAVTGTVNDVMLQGSSAGSLVVEQADQSILFPAIGDKVTTDAVGLAATADSGSAIFFAVASGPAAIAGGTNLTFTGAGSVSIMAFQPGNGNYNAATTTTTFNVRAALEEIEVASLIVQADGSDTFDAILETVPADVDVTISVYGSVVFNEETGAFTFELLTEGVDYALDGMTVTIQRDSQTPWQFYRIGASPQ
jgi:MBG domain/FG-GAP repeat